MVLIASVLTQNVDGCGAAVRAQVWGGVDVAVVIAVVPDDPGTRGTVAG